MLNKNLVTAALAGLTLLLGASAWAAEPPATAPVYAAKGEQTCLKCHDESPVVDILKTPHAMKGDSRTPFANHGCETCHGAAPDHVAAANKAKKGEKPAVFPPVQFNGPNAASAKERSAVCLQCHENSVRINWTGSKHDRNDVGCNNCHTVHVIKEPMLVKASQPEKCFTCHAQQRAESFQYSHHPMREGKVVCSDCHAAHGATGNTKLLKEFSINETCYLCHAEKRGPLLWEHQPVRENCINCHAPHGSSQARLLTERLPYLCSTCHSSTGNSSSGFFGGHQSLPGGASSVGQTTSWQIANGLMNVEFQYRSCLNCHTQVHGSNSPNGVAFLR